MTLILFSAPFSSHIRTHTHTHSQQGVSSNGTSLCVWEKQTINLQHCVGHQGYECCWPHTHTHTHLGSTSYRPVLPSSAAFTHTANEEERVRDSQTTWQTQAYTKTWGGNKQADVSNEVGGFAHSEGIWVVPSDESLTGRLSCSITDTDEGD